MVSVVIVNWNSGNQLAKLLETLCRNHDSLVDAVIVVDNNSNDESIESISGIGEENFKFKLIRNSVNRGFAAGCNQGAKTTNSKYILFLNPDAMLMEGSIRKPIDLMEHSENKNIGICGIKLINERGETSISAARFPNLTIFAGKSLGLSNIFPKIFPSHFLQESDLIENPYVDQIIGAFFLIRTNLFLRCGGFDERFFVYFEEVDLSLRVSKFGYHSFFLKTAVAYHKGGGCSESAKAHRLAYMWHSRFLYADKHFSLFDQLGLIALTIVEIPIRILKAAITRPSFEMWYPVHGFYLLLIRIWSGVWK